MKRKLKYVVGIIVVVALACPYIAGRYIEKDYNGLLEHLNKVTNGEVTFAGKFYRGFFSSTATTEITFKNSYQSLQLAHFIKHGPLIFHAYGWLHPSSYIPHGFALGVINTNFTGDFENILQDAYAGNPAYSIITTISLYGNVDTDINSYPVTTDMGKGKLEWQGLQASLKTNINLDKVLFNVTLPLIDYSETTSDNMQQSAHVANINLNILDSFAMNDATYDLTIENSKIVSNSTTEFNIDGFTISGDRKVAQGLMSVNLHLGFNKLDLATIAYGPLTFGLQAKNLDPEAMQALMQQPQPELLMKVPPALLIKLLSNKIEIDSSFSFTTPDGSISVASHSEAGGPSIAKLAPNATISTDQLLSTVTANHTLQVSKNLAMKILARYAENKIHNQEVMYFINNKTSNIKNPYTMTPELLQLTVKNWVTVVLYQLQQQKYITEKDDIISTTIGYANSALTANGKIRTKQDLDMIQSLFENIIPPPAGAAATPEVKKK